MPVLEMIPVGDASPNAWVAWSTSPRQGAALDPGGPRDRVDPNAAHAGEVDDETVIDGAEAGGIVSAAADGDVELLVAAECERCNDVSDIGRANDKRRVSIDHAVRDAAGVVVAGSSGPMSRPEGGLQTLRARFRRCAARVRAVWPCALPFALGG